ncbi:MAG: LON peptidase substrate-binding domain-containing protein [Bacteriovorax sp.]|nr:LON peptidase substrate-binding domain-containing protein [Bacteriovorax sp.]
MVEANAESNSWKAPVLSLNDAVLFPEILLPIAIFSQKGKEAINAALAGPEKTLIVVSVRIFAKEKIEVNEDDLYQVGTKAIISHMARYEDGISLSLSGIERIKINKYESHVPYLLAQSTPYPLLDDSDPESEALNRETLKKFEEMKLNVQTENGISISELIKNVPDPVHQSYLMAVVMGLAVDKSQVLLEAKSTKEVCKIMHDYISYEDNVQMLRDRISKQVADELGKEQKEYVLRRQLSEIQKELGDVTDKGTIREMEDQLLKGGLPEKAHDEVKKQLKRLSQLTEMSPEYQVIDSYVKSLLELPWNKKTEDNLDLNRAETILDEDHYDLKK